MASRNVRCTPHFRRGRVFPAARGLAGTEASCQGSNSDLNCADELQGARLASHSLLDSANSRKFRNFSPTQVAHRLFGTELGLNATGSGFTPICNRLARRVGLELRFGFPYGDLHDHAVAEVHAGAGGVRRTRAQSAKRCPTPVSAETSRPRTRQWKPPPAWPAIPARIPVMARHVLAASYSPRSATAELPSPV